MAPQGASSGRQALATARRSQASFWESKEARPSPASGRNKVDATERCNLPARIREWTRKASSPWPMAIRSGKRVRLQPVRSHPGGSRRSVRIAHRARTSTAARRQVHAPHPQKRRKAARLTLIAAASKVGGGRIACLANAAWRSAVFRSGSRDEQDDRRPFCAPLVSNASRNR